MSFNTDSWWGLLEALASGLLAAVVIIALLTWHQRREGRRVREEVRRFQAMHEDADQGSAE